MEVKVNGIHLPGQASTSANESPSRYEAMNGFTADEILEDTGLAELEKELPHVYDGQVELKELLTRVMQAIYAELTEMAETYVRTALKL